MLIIYKNYIDIMICTPETEKAAVRQFFSVDDRCIVDYEREERTDHLCVSFNVTVE